MPSVIPSGRRPSATAWMIASLRPAVLPSAACTYHSYCCVNRRDTSRMTNSLTSRGSELPKRRYVPIFAALIISCGLRLSGTNGPKTACFRSTRNSAAAFFCASVSLSAAIGGSRSCAEAGDAHMTVTVNIPRMLPAVRCQFGAVLISSSQFDEAADEPPDTFRVDEVMAGAIFLEIAADDQAVYLRQHRLDVVRRRAASNQQREACRAPDNVNIVEAGLDPRAIAGDNNGVGEAALREIAGLDVQAAAGKRCRVLDADVCENQRARFERRAKAHRQVARPLHDPLVGGDGTHVHVDADVMRACRDRDRDRRFTVAAQDVDADRHPGNADDFA